MFLLQWIAKLLYGKEYVEEFERQQRQPKPVRRAPIKARPRRVKK